MILGCFVTFASSLIQINSFPRQLAANTTLAAFFQSRINCCDEASLLCLSVQQVLPGECVCVRVCACVSGCCKLNPLLTADI